jgi:serine/threonine-protein phosphatase 2A activator
LEFIQKLNYAAMGKKLGSTNCSEPVQRVLELIETLSKYIYDFPPLESNQRFGNLAFRDWIQKMQQESLPLTKLLLEESKYSEEIAAYLAGAFGNGQRIDYGSGHELSFVAWLCCLYLVGFFDGICFF